MKFGENVNQNAFRLVVANLKPAGGGSSTVSKDTGVSDPEGSALARVQRAALRKEETRAASK